MRPPAILPEAKRERDTKITPKKQPASNYSTPSNSALTSSTSKPRYILASSPGHSQFFNVTHRKTTGSGLGTRLGTFYTLVIIYGIVYTYVVSKKQQSRSEYVCIVILGKNVWIGWSL